MNSTSANNLVFVAPEECIMKTKLKETCGKRCYIMDIII